VRSSPARPPAGTRDWPATDLGPSPGTPEASFADVDGSDRMAASLAARSGDRVLDAGCGAGDEVAGLAARGVTAVGADRSQGMTTRAARDRTAGGPAVPGGPRAVGGPRAATAPAAIVRAAIVQACTLSLARLVAFAGWARVDA
jgi:SAM-dependent methyltransferase